MKIIKLRDGGVIVGLLTLDKNTKNQKERTKGKKNQNGGEKKKKILELLFNIINIAEQLMINTEPIGAAYFSDQLTLFFIFSTVFESNSFVFS